MKNLKPNDSIPTPLWLVNEMLEIADIKSAETVLDPCAGDDRFCEAWKSMHPGEVYQWLSMDISPKAERVEPWDFFERTPERLFDVAILNPPFSDLGGVRFLSRLLEGWIKPAGRIIMVFPWTQLIQQVKGYERYQWLNKYLVGMFPVSMDAFREYGVNVLWSMVCVFQPIKSLHYSPRMLYPKLNNEQGEIFG